MSISSYLKRGISFIIHGQPVKNVTANITTLSPDQRLCGKKIIVTGGGRGLGFTMAKKFVAEGAQVLISGRNEKVLKKVSEEIGCFYLVLDVQNSSEMKSFISKADEMLSGVDCLVNNAGISLHEGNILNVTFEQFDAQINTNLRGGYFLAQQFVENFVNNKRKNGNILFVSSERGDYVDDLPYGITKNAINCLVQGLARRIIGYDIRVNAVAPGVTASDMTGLKSNGNISCNFNATGRIYLPEEVAEVACFLLSDVSNCLSGQILVCNEGKSLNSHWK